MFPGTTYTVGWSCCLLVALACDVRSLFDESIQGSVKNSKKRRRALKESLDLIRTKLPEKGTSPLDKEEEDIAALEEIASTVPTLEMIASTVPTICEDGLDEVEGSRIADERWLLQCSASSLESQLPTLEKEPHHCLQPKRYHQNAITIPVVLCLAYSKTLGPLWHWLLLTSLHVERKSSLSERMEQYLPLSRISMVLENTYALSFSGLLVSITCVILSASLLLQNGDNKARALITTITLFLLALAGSQWGNLGGSALEFFMLYMPFALSIGCSLGLALIHRTRGCIAATQL